MRDFDLYLDDNSDLLTGLWEYQLDQAIYHYRLLSPSELWGLGEDCSVDFTRPHVVLHPTSTVDVIELMSVIENTVVRQYEKKWLFHLKVQDEVVATIWFPDGAVLEEEISPRDTKPIKEVNLDFKPPLSALAATGYDDEVREVQITAFRLGMPLNENSPFLIHRINAQSGNLHATKLPLGETPQSGYEAAHRLLAALSPTDHFLVVDEDNHITDTPDFDFTTELNGKVFVFYSENPYNGLVYGHGGIKLFNKKDFQNLPPLPEGHDFTQWVAKHSKYGLEVVPQRCSIHKYARTQLDGAVTAYRENHKLATHLLTCEKGTEEYIRTVERLSVWSDPERYSFSMEYQAKAAELARMDVMLKPNLPGHIKTPNINNLLELRTYLEHHSIPFIGELS